MGGRDRDRDKDKDRDRDRDRGDKKELRKPRKKINPLLGVKHVVIDYKDTALLRKFISDRGKIRSRRVTGVSTQEQRQIALAVKRAREMALLPYAGSGR